ncbi:MAG: hypothetical protein P1R58_00825 [bacterium]|nr:hypothetical protein [bacterium]
MKVNSIGIQSYQQVSQQQARPAATATEEQSKSADKTKLSIPVQDASESSRLAIKAPGDSYAKFLSVEERQALDLLFGKFRDAERFGSGYNRDMEANNDGSKLGRVVDLKV